MGWEGGAAPECVSYTNVQTINHIERGNGNKEKEGPTSLDASGRTRIIGINRWVQQAGQCPHPQPRHTHTHSLPKSRARVYLYAKSREYCVMVPCEDPRRLALYPAPQLLSSYRDKYNPLQCSQDRQHWTLRHTSAGTKSGVHPTPSLSMTHVRPLDMGAFIYRFIIPPPSLSGYCNRLRQAEFD